MQLPSYKPREILVEQFLLLLSHSSQKGPLHLQATIKLKLEGRELLSTLIAEDTTKPFRGRSANGEKNSYAKSHFLITKLGDGV